MLFILFNIPIQYNNFMILYAATKLYTSFAVSHRVSLANWFRILTYKFGRSFAQSKLQGKVAACRSVRRYSA